MKIKNLILFIIFALIFVSIGYLLAVLTFKYKVSIEYNTASIKHNISIGPFAVRDELLKENLFQCYPYSSIGELYLTEKPDWHTAFEFSSFSNQSHNYQGGMVLNDAVKLTLLFQHVSKDGAGKMKDQFLKVLRTKDIGSLSNFVSNKEQEILKRIQDNMTPDKGDHSKEEK